MQTMSFLQMQTMRKLNIHDYKCRHDAENRIDGTNIVSAEAHSNLLNIITTLSQLYNFTSYRERCNARTHKQNIPKLHSVRECSVIKKREIERVRPLHSSC